MSTRILDVLVVGSRTLASSRHAPSCQLSVAAPDRSNVAMFSCSFVRTLQCSNENRMSIEYKGMLVRDARRRWRARWAGRSARWSAGSASGATSTRRAASRSSASPGGSSSTTFSSGASASTSSTTCAFSSLFSSLLSASHNMRGRTSHTVKAGSYIDMSRSHCEKHESGSIFDSCSTASHLSSETSATTTVIR